MSEKGRLEALSRMIAVEMGKAASKPELRIAGQAELRLRPQWSSVDRESRIRWLRALRRALKYMHVDLFFQQALVGKMDLEELSDEELLDLHRTIDKARDHYHTADGVSYYEAGLLRSHGEVA